MASRGKSPTGSISSAKSGGGLFSESAKNSMDNIDVALGADNINVALSAQAAGQTVTPEAGLAVPNGGMPVQNSGYYGQGYSSQAPFHGHPAINQPSASAPAVPSGCPFSVAVGPSGGYAYVNGFQVSMPPLPPALSAMGIYPYKRPFVPDWGHVGNSEPLFRYCKFGVELEASLKYRRSQIWEFICKGPGYRDPPFPPPGRNLTLWIHTPPPASARYLQGQSASKCRWDRCPEKHNSIRRGFWRVAFDEHSNQSGEVYDPYHNAMYMHLYCLEKALDLPNLIMLQGGPGRHYQVRFDMRKFVHEQCKLSKDQREQILAVYHEWLAEQIPRVIKHVASFEGQKPPSRQPWIPETDRLWYRLTTRHMETFNHRADTDFYVHRGNLDRFIELKARRQELAQDFEEDAEYEDEDEL